PHTFDSQNILVSIPHCALNGTARTSNGTCFERVDQLFQAFSSTVVLFVLIAMIIGIIFVSVTTFHFHKSKMKKRKIQKAQEEYERDNCSPKAVKGKPVVRQCIMVRPPTAARKSDPNTEDPGVTEDVRHSGQGKDDNLLESVAVS
uniref:Si:dkey-35i13.1 n=1 Tax=Sinocyclocheilus rhinocerous TaxID=307959 RepID=A0A673NBE3_9TELE